jgi:hypothetical protein
MIGYGNSMFLATHGILARSASGVPVDPDAQAFITAAAITDPTQQAAINTLVLDLKSNALWDKSYALYPIVGGTASSHKFNLKDPRDLDAAFRLNYATGVNHSATGMVGNGTTGYANTFFNPTTEGVGIDNYGVGCNSLTDLVAAVVDIGGRQSSSVGATQMLIRYSTNLYQFRINNNNLGTLTSTGATTSIGNFGMNRLNSTQLRFTINGTTAVFSQASGTLQNDTTFLMALSTSGTASAFSTREYTFFRIHQGLTDSEEATFQTIITNFNTALGR